MLTAAVTPRGTTVSLTLVSIGPGQTAEESLDVERPRPKSTGLQTPAWPPHRPKQQAGRGLLKLFGRLCSGLRAPPFTEERPEGQ